MRRWLKSILVLVCVMALCALLAACGSEAETAPNPDAIALTQEEEQQWYESAEQFIWSMNDAVATGTSILTEDDPVYGPAMESWKNALPEIGEVVSVEGKSTEFTKKEGTVRMNVHGSSHDAEVVITMDMGDSYYEIRSITTNVIYSFKELMQQAGLNTLLGMGTTFAVLILLSLIIALFGSMIRRAFERTAVVTERVERRKPVQQSLSEPAVIKEEPETAYMEDTALIAVITAAVAAYEEAAQAEAQAAQPGAAAVPPADGFVVRSIRKSRRRF